MAAGGGGGRGRGRGARMGRDRDLIGQTIKITQGPYKGRCRSLWVYVCWGGEGRGFSSCHHSREVGFGGYERRATLFYATAFTLCWL